MSASETQILEFWRDVLSAILSVYTHTCTHIHADGRLWTQSAVIAETQMKEINHTLTTFHLSASAEPR